MDSPKLEIYMVMQETCGKCSKKFIHLNIQMLFLSILHTASSHVLTLNKPSDWTVMVMSPYVISDE